MAGQTSPTSTDLLAAASEFLEGGGYRRVEQSSLNEWPLSNFRVFEDPYSVVAVVVFETWADVSANWTSAQGALVELVSENLSQTDAKAWEAYLVLLTPSPLPEDARTEAADIRYNVSRARKLLATGDELLQVGDVERALLPLLPLSDAHLEAPGSVLDMLPDLLARRGLPSTAVRAVLDAFYDQRPLVEALHNFRTGHAAQES